MPRTKSADPTAPAGPRLVAKSLRVKPAPTVTHEQIALRAYELFLQESGGSDVAHWLRAEQELQGSQLPVRPARKAAGARLKG